MQTTIGKIANKVKEGQRLTEADAFHLFESKDLIETGYLAAQLNEIKNKQHVSISDNRYVRTTFEGYYQPFFQSLKECDSKRLCEEKIEQYLNHVIHRTEQVISKSTTELRLCSVNSAILPFYILLRVIELLRCRFPSLHLRALSAPEIKHYTQTENLSLAYILKSLAEAGLCHMNGRGGAPDFPFIHPAVPIDTNSWFEIHRMAHQFGIKSDATMAYGHGETFYDRLRFMSRVRHLQDETSGFISFAVLPKYIHGERLSLTLGIDDLKTIAVSRIYLNNISTITSSWGRFGLDIAQLSLNFGANDLDGTLSNDTNARVIGARPYRSVTQQKIESIIRKARLVPIKRSLVNEPLDIAALTHLNRDENLIARLLYQTEQDKQLTLDEAITLTRDASLLELGYCSSLVKSKLMNTQKVGVLANAYELPLELLLNTDEALNHVQEKLVSRFEDQTLKEYAIHINLGKWDSSLQTLRLSHIVQFFTCLKERQLPLQFVVKGLKGLWQLARLDGQPLIRVLQSLKDCFVTIIESSGSEAEDDFTTSEIITTHRAIHELDISSVAKVELAAPPSGLNPPFWEAFIKRLDSLRELQDETNGFLGIKVEPARRALISPHEYLKALAISRIFLKNFPNIIAPFLKIPSLEEKNGKPSVTTFKSCLKFVPVCIQFGANDIGFVKYDQSELTYIFQELGRSGINYYGRNMRFYQIQ